VNPPPFEIDGAPVRLFAVLDQRVRRTRGSDHQVIGIPQRPAQALAICERQRHYYLIGCDLDWQPFTESRHDTLEDAKRQAENEFTGIGTCWTDISDSLNAVGSHEADRRMVRPVNRDEVIWSGHAYSYAGYAKMNREILVRLSSSKKVKLANAPSSELRLVDDAMQRTLDAIRDAHVSETATWVRGYTPRSEDWKGRRICLTMMETQRVHPDFVRALNGYDECWTPTAWNRETFRTSGVTIPIRVVPLGVDPNVFRPRQPGELPKAELLSTGRIGARESPAGFVFVTMYQPTFRKGLPFLLEAFTSAFENDPEAALMLATTIHSHGSFERNLARRSRVRVYGLRGAFSEEQLANLFSSCHAYVSTSVGEGWNLPLCEAAACGIPVIAGRHSAHAEILSDETAYLFDPQGYGPVPGSEKVCHWYKDQPFALFGKKSIQQLATLLRYVKFQYTEARRKAVALSRVIRTKYSWDISARTVSAFLDDQGKAFS